MVIILSIKSVLDLDMDTYTFVIGFSYVHILIIMLKLHYNTLSIHEKLNESVICNNEKTHMQFYLRFEFGPNKTMQYEIKAFILTTYFPTFLFASWRKKLSLF